MEVGRAQGITTLALNMGRRNFVADEGGEKASYYFYEPKVSVSKNIADNVQAFGLFGAGGFFDSNHFLIEYGLGVNWSVGPKTSVCTQASNWDGADYVTFGVSRTF